MKIGLVLECQRLGPDEMVLRNLISRLRPDLQIVSQCMGNKPALIRECGKVTKDLYEIEKCDFVLIVWDLWPAWRDSDPCLHEDREKIALSLGASGVRDNAAGLVCITEELETWLVADGRAVTARINQLRGGRGALKARIPDENPAEAVSSPKQVLRRIFRSDGEVRPYNDWEDAGRIAQALPDLSRLEKIPTFDRLRKFVAAC